jgi:hypothetical protein
VKNGPVIIPSVNLDACETMTLWIKAVSEADDEEGGKGRTPIQRQGR